MRTRFPITALLSSLLLIGLFFCDDVISQRSRRRRTNRRQSRRYVAPGSNMCKVHKVLGTQQNYFTHCVTKHFKVICERPTYLSWECCSGFVKQRGEKGCTGVRPLYNIMETSDVLDLNQFREHAQLADMDVELRDGGAYTVFAPTDRAIMEVTSRGKSELSGNVAGSPSLINYHIAPGRLDLSVIHKKNQQFVTLYNGLHIRVNKYAFGVATVNCARILRPDEKATNGIIHVIDKVLNPLDVQGTLADRIRDDDSFTQFHMALLVSKMARKLRTKSGSFTVLVPTNHAFSKLSRDIWDKILNDADTAEKVIKRHVVRGVYCADAIVLAVGLKTLDDHRLLFRCKREGLRINEAHVLHPDIVAGNGVIHGIDTVLLPDSVKSTYDLMSDMRLERFLALAKEAGLNGTLEAGNVTIFSPTDRAIAELPPRYLASLRENPVELKKLIGYHLAHGQLPDDKIVGDMSLSTVGDLGAKIRVSVHRNGILLDNATLDPNWRQCRNAVVRRVDKVLIPPERDLHREMLAHPDLSEFTAMFTESGVAAELIDWGGYTIFAPTNQALNQVDQRQLRQIRNNQDRLKKFVQRHVILRTIMKCSIPEKGVYVVPSRQGDETKSTLDWKLRLIINKHAITKSNDIIATNGVLYKIDHVLPCTCERNMRNRRGRYFSHHLYRRHH